MTTDFDQLLVESGGTPREIADAAVLMAEATLHDPRADDTDRALAQGLLDRGSDNIAETLLSQRIFGADVESDTSSPPVADTAEESTASTRDATSGQRSTRASSGMKDPIADFLGQLRDANAALRPEAEFRTSKIKENIAKLLKDEGYIADYRIEDGRIGKTLVVTLKYGPGDQRRIAGLRRVSQPGLRVYAKSTNLPRVLGGMGVAIISTSSGLMTDRQALKDELDGEVLAYVW
ncbi:ribosomal protein S8 [Mycolicibacterium rhodesiae JS60]|nr:ribosomal protein S8 [Mycolicibacterium rhodesiae JS60]